MREAGLEPARPKTQVPKTCVSAISPLPQKSVLLATALRINEESQLSQKRYLSPVAIALGYG